MDDKKWYDGIPKHPYRKGISGRWMPAPYDNIFIGSDPRDGQTKKWANQFDAIVNVSCTEGALFEPSRPDQRSYWHPLNEGSEWSYAYFFMMFKIIDHHYRKKDKIYIHCAAGVYRSPSIFRWWLIACENKRIEEANHIERGMTPDDRDAMMEHYSVYQNYLLGNIPPNFQEFIERIRTKGIKEASFVDILWQPFRLNDSLQVRSKRMKTLREHYWGPMYNIKRPFKDLAEKIKYWYNDYIVMRVSSCGRITAKDWLKLSKKRPKREKERENKK